MAYSAEEHEKPQSIPVAFDRESRWPRSLPLTLVSSTWTPPYLSIFFVPTSVGAVATAGLRSALAADIRHLINLVTPDFDKHVGEPSTGRPAQGERWEPFTTVF